MQRCSATFSRLLTFRHKAIKCPALCLRSLSARAAFGTQASAHNTVDDKKIRATKPAVINVGGDSSHEQLHARRSQELLDRLSRHLPARYRGWHVEGHATSAQALGQLLVDGIHSDLPQVDILYELAVTKGQWKAAVWVVQELLNSTTTQAVQDDRLSKTVLRQSQLPMLEQLTNERIETSLDSLYTASPTCSTPIAELTSLTSGESGIQNAHQILGCVWRSMGLMTLACAKDASIAGGSVKPEVLEMLALFHHHGLMPDSVYNYTPSAQAGIIQQPATLYVLSSRIMVALSDAAWRARETAALESHGGSSTRLEMLGSSVRANIEAVIPEMWLELILWSCIHGGWVASGADVLEAVAHERRPHWKALSWRRTIRDYLGVSDSADVDWTEELTVFQLSRKGKHDPEIVQFKHTLSSELVNAYVEAIIDFTSHDSSNHIPMRRALKQVEALRRFLKMTRLTMHGSTWDARMLRLADDNKELVGRIDLLTELTKLQPNMGEEYEQDQISKPWFVLEPNTALLGLLHRALRHQIDISSIAGATKIVALIQERVDETRRKSIEDLLARSSLFDRPQQHPIKRYASSSRDHFRGIDDSAFDSQIPVSTMAAFLDLITQTSSFRLGAALVQDNSIDGPFIHRKEWGNPILASSLIRFAVASQDDVLLSKVIRDRNIRLAQAETARAALKPVMSDVLSETFVTHSWPSSRGVLAQIRASSKYNVEPPCLAVLAAEIIRLERGSLDAKIARELFEDILGRSGQLTKPPYDDKMHNILKIMTLIDHDCADLGERLEVHKSIYAPSVKVFDTLLAAVAAQSTSKAVHLMDTMLDDVDARIIPPAPLTNLAGRKLYLQRALKPMLSSYVIILRSMLGRADFSDTDTQQVIAWSAKGMLKAVGNSYNPYSTVHAELQQVLVELRLERYRGRLTKSLKDAAVELGLPYG